MERKTFVGLFAALCVWLTAGLALPFVNVLKMCTPEQLLTVRGYLTAAITFAVLRGDIFRVDRYTYLVGLCTPFASLGLFKAVRAWGAGPTFIILTATPFINFLFTLAQGKRVPKPALGALALLLGGVFLARWGGTFTLAGFGWSLLSTIGCGLLYELVSRSKATSFQRCFWASFGMGTIGLIGSLSTSWTAVLESPRLQLTLLAFAFVGGFLYSIATFFTFQHLPKDIASVLVQGETPSVIFFSGVILGEQLTGLQWFGVFLALCGAAYLSRWFSQQPDDGIEWVVET